jgi:hypothetical protein
MASFELDDLHACVWINYQHDRFRLNCSNKIIMQFWVCYWYCREFPFSSENERTSFRKDFTLFLDSNWEKISALSRETGAQRIRLLCDLREEIGQELCRARRKTFDAQVIMQNAKW